MFTLCSSFWICLIVWRERRQRFARKPQQIWRIGIRFLQPPQSWLVISLFFSRLVRGLIPHHWAQQVTCTWTTGDNQAATWLLSLGPGILVILSPKNTTIATSPSPLVKTARWTSFFGISVKLSEAWRISTIYTLHWLWMAAVSLGSLARWPSGFPMFSNPSG